MFAASWPGRTTRYFDTNSKDGRKDVPRTQVVEVVSTAALAFTMGTFEGEETARILSEFLGYYNLRRDAGPPDSYRIVRALIQALGTVGHTAGLEELTMVTISEAWEAAVKRAAAAALRKINP